MTLARLRDDAPTPPIRLRPLPPPEVPRALAKLAPLAADLFCTDPGCPCVNHQRPDVAMLAIYGIDERRLTPTEARLVAALLPPGTLCTREVLMTRVFGAVYLDVGRDPFHVLRVNVTRLRRKLPAQGYSIDGVPMLGYRLVSTTGSAR